MLSFTFGSEKIPPPSPGAVQLRGEPAEKAPSGLLGLFSRKTQNRQATRTGSPEPELDGSEENTTAAHPPAQQLTRSGTPDWVTALGSESALASEPSTESPAIISRAYPLPPPVATSALGSESCTEPTPPTEPNLAPAYGRRAIFAQMGVSGSAVRAAPATPTDVTADGVIASLQREYPELVAAYDDGIDKQSSSTPTDVTADGVIASLKREYPELVSVDDGIDKQSSWITAKPKKIAPTIPTAATADGKSEALAVADEGMTSGVSEALAVAEEGVTSEELHQELHQLFRVIASPVTLSMWVLYQTGSVTLTVLSRIYLTIHSIAFEADPGKFERILMHNVHFMDGSMRQMNGSLTSAISTIDRQMGDINRLESMWQKEHEAYLAAVEEKKLAETEFQETARRFREELAAAKRAAVSVCAGSPVVGGALCARILCVCCACETASDAGAHLKLSSKRIILVAFLWRWAT